MPDLYPLFFKCLADPLYKCKRFWSVSMYTARISLDIQILSFDGCYLAFFAHPYTDLSVLITEEAPLSQWKVLFDYMDTHDTLKNVLYID